MTRPARAIKLLLALASLAVVSAAGAATPEPIPPASVAERFAVARGGDALLVPVRLAGKNRLFLVDTGSTHTLCDAAVPLGEPLQTITRQTPTGPRRLNVYAPPAGEAVGCLPLRGPKGLVAVDLSRVREVTGSPVEGVLGMDFLGGHILHVDFDRGELLFLTAAPPDGSEVPIVHRPGVGPTVAIDLGGAGAVPFLIDTGCVSPFAGAVESQALSAWVADGVFRRVGKTLAVTAGGTEPGRLVRGAKLGAGGFAVDGPVLGETSGPHLLGLGFWSRFATTFDFPAGKMFLRPGTGYRRADRWGTRGIHLTKTAGAVRVARVDDGSPGAAAGVKAGDVLVAAGPKRAADVSLFDLRLALCGGGMVAVAVRRGEADHHLTVTLPD